MQQLKFDAVCCRQLGEILPGLLTDYRPDLVLYDAGIDPHAGDALGRLALTDEGLHRRELVVCLQRWFWRSS